MPRPLRATIDLECMRHNLALARACAPDARVWAVVKANAYGHGLEFGLRGFGAADGLALVELDNALRLRELGWTRPILLLEGIFADSDISQLWEHDLECVVHSIEQLKMLEYTRLPRPIDVHLKMNTGMNRLGFTPDAYRAAHARLRAIPGVGKISLMTHFANADELEHPLLPMREQMLRFLAGADGLPGERSLCNSGGVLQRSTALAQDWIRPGIMLYGASPGGHSAAELGLRPCMTLSSEIIGIQQLAPGDTVGYGSRFRAEAPTTIGVVACGYADGYPRHAAHGTPVLVDGHRTALLGRVSMDMLTVDLGPIPNARVGSKVTLWGHGLPIDEVAQAAGTIGYELMCALSPRVPLLQA
ncbi:MAG: alanine racemase [Massilia sp.]